MVEENATAPVEVQTIVPGTALIVTVGVTAVPEVTVTGITVDEVAEQPVVPDVITTPKLPVTLAV
jgi:hypothetical protein